MPFVFLNAAITADGKLAPATRHFMAFAGQRDRQHLFELRATADAVMSGARTVDLSPVTLGTGGVQYRHARLREGLQERHVRIIVSGTGSIDPDAKIFKDRSSPIIVLTSGRAPAARLRKLRRLADDVKVCGKKGLNFAMALRWLRRKWQVKRLLCEGGGEVNGGLLEAGLVDEIHLTIAPVVFGGRKAPTLADGSGFGRIADALPLTLKSMERVGDELFLVFRVGE